MAAQTAVYPLDVVRRRMQTASTVLYTSTTDALLTIARNEGIANGLYRGLALCALDLTRLVRSACQQLQAHLRHRRRRHHHRSFVLPRL
jgi:hypothetical protein